ncbi:hypothetical protein KHS38_21780 [Mucilaginibacter sp. Bleaf8]|uniref:hypothetical protein n=1 Tax=Mucilaginibacter sp. Bleaf8 TaxID=2834430 RepID=UPI001BCAFB32|nr:hypothetical protein [Mucilaginibacter sp. Bleaf8]MBS7567050.1 hypothetical protein [Mucilaginibacter sp. Bleaf8]
MYTLTLLTGRVKKAVLLALLATCTTIAYAQNGTYEKKNANGAYSVISFQKIGTRVKAEIFTWWNSSNDQTGSYYGEGSLKNNTVILHSDENEPGCKVTLSLVQGKIKASFANCSTDHLTEDFNGLYNKITDAVAGDYIVTSPKAYFYKKADAASKLKAYVLKGDKVILDMQNMAASTQKWVFVSFSNKAGKETTGYMLLSDLKRAE